MVPRIACATALAAATLGVLAPASVGTPSLGDPDFKGTERKGPQANVKILFRVVENGGARKGIVFQARDLQLACNDGSERRITLEPLSIPFESRNQFRREVHSVDDQGTEVFVEVDGRFTSPRRVRGGLLYILDTANPPATTGPPDCSTRGRVFWKAQRVG